MNMAHIHFRTDVSDSINHNQLSQQKLQCWLIATNNNQYTMYQYAIRYQTVYSIQMNWKKVNMKMNSIMDVQ